MHLKALVNPAQNQPMTKTAPVSVRDLILRSLFIPQASLPGVATAGN